MRKLGGNVHKPLLGTTDLTSRNAGLAVASQVGRVHRKEGDIPRIDGERLAPESQSNRRGGGARNREASLSIRLGSRNSSVDSCGISRGGDNESGSLDIATHVSIDRKLSPRDKCADTHGVHNGSSAAESQVLTVDREGIDSAFPESFLVDVRDADESRSVELGSVQSTEGDLPVVEVIVKTRNLERSDGCGDGTSCG